MENRLAILLARLSPAGLFFSAILFALSMTPSMVPRGPELQDVLGGCVFAIGYLAWYALRSVLE